MTVGTHTHTHHCRLAPSAALTTTTTMDLHPTSTNIHTPTRNPRASSGDTHSTSLQRIRSTYFAFALSLPLDRHPLHRVQPRTLLTDLSPDSASRGAVQQCEHTLCANTQDSFTIHMLNDVGVSAAVQLRLYREDTPEWWHGDSDVTMGRFG
jgi:hypothetical protein